MDKLDPIKISFIIPALNEAANLPATLAAIKKYADKLNYEIIIADNGSTDETPKIAAQYGAIVLQDKSKTIGGLRNLGAFRAEGMVLVFLDADVHITKPWEEEITKVISQLYHNNRIITGSRCGISDQNNWIEKQWFLPMIHERSSNYINSGHMIICKDIFIEIGGFDEELITAEDWDLCMKAKRLGVSIVNNTKLSTIHQGYPKSLKAFIHRERWHGLQDISAVSSLLQSYPAIVALLYWLVGIASIVLSLYHGTFIFIIFGVALNSTLCIIATINKNRKYHLNFVYYFIIYHAYFIARGLSLVDFLLKGKPVAKHKRLVS